ncbi:MAG: hypothetical protein KGM47_16075, partial [Acidobacteriota bacterium]|nr:hypothetical protein [Acidobacteriota bacterium]
GCIYSQMKMCMAPCFKGCTDAEYADEVRRVIAFLESGGKTLESELQTRRDQASANLEFEHAAEMHCELEKVKAVSKLRPSLVREVANLHAVILLPGAAEKTVTFFRVLGGEMRGPVSLSLAENVSSPVSLDREIQNLMASLAGDENPAGANPSLQPSEGGRSPGQDQLPPWEHISLLARWYYSSFRTGEILMLAGGQKTPFSRLVKLCRRIVEQDV